MVEKNDCYYVSNLLFVPKRSFNKKNCFILFFIVLMFYVKNKFLKIEKYFNMYPKKINLKNIHYEKNLLQILVRSLSNLKLL